MTKIEKTNKVAAAEVLGQQAFVAGKSAASCMDEKFLELLGDSKVGESLPILQAWARGWHNANLCADIQ